MKRLFCISCLLACAIASQSQTARPVFSGAYTFQSAGYSASLAVVDGLWQSSSLKVPGAFRLDLVAGTRLRDGAPLVGIFAGWQYERPIVGKLFGYVDAGCYLLQAQGSSGFSFKAGVGFGLAVKL